MAWDGLGSGLRLALGVQLRTTGAAACPVRIPVGAAIAHHSPGQALDPARAHQGPAASRTPTGLICRSRGCLSCAAGRWPWPSWPHVTTWTWDKIMTLWSSFIRVSMRLTENIIALTTVHMPCVYTHVSAVINSGTYTHRDTHSELSQCYHIPQHLHRIRNRHTPHLHIRAHAGHTAYATF